ncbi:hypothetical protein ABZT47_28825 [Sphaerisporangium sp. NPDC005289]|uniref:hypothetical protein n=1 Tax=Sphaerisporangium sp. NPDC005289 TaxID=3155247 RepID=UPI0033AA0A0E
MSFGYVTDAHRRDDEAVHMVCDELQGLCVVAEGRGDQRDPAQAFDAGRTVDFRQAHSCSEQFAAFS